MKNKIKYCKIEKAHLKYTCSIEWWFATKKLIENTT